MEKKRVHCLYRVSTLGQVEKDDIPMQKQCCREFAAAQGWEIRKEYSEKGVSGFKVSAKDRDAILDLQRDAVEGKFEILLVYMFDRVGRRDDETPFVVEWFVKNGIEVWSTIEGQQRFDNHVDKLMNYIRYWQAAGESEKTSIRVKTRLGQIVQEGRFRGGTAPYGYKLVKMGRKNKKNREVCDLQIDGDEAAVVRMIFDKYTDEGYGSQRISTYLYERGLRNRKGKNFVNCTIQHMLENRAYTGVLRSGDTESEIFPHLQIITPAQFERAQEILRQRSLASSDRSVPLNTKGQCLLAGLLTCGHCGARLMLTTSLKGYVKRDGERTETRRLRYVCYNKTRHKDACGGPSGYSATKLDGIIETILDDFFGRVEAVPKADFIGRQFAKQSKGLQATLKQAKKELSERCRLLEDLNGELIRVIRGESKFTSERLEKMIAQAEADVGHAREAAAALEAQQQESAAQMEKLSNQYDEFIRWNLIFKGATMEAKKMIVSQLIKKISVSRDYRLDIAWNISFSQFLSPDGSPELQDRAV